MSGFIVLNAEEDSMNRHIILFPLHPHVLNHEGSHHIFSVHQQVWVKFILHRLREHVRDDSVQRRHQ